MKISNYLKWIAAIIIALMIILSLFIIFSPYGAQDGFTEKLVIEKVIINAPAMQVYQYLGNSNNAFQWSSYVDHIIPLNPETAQDGTVGAKRRCYKEPDETGIIWDEEILINEPSQRRQLSIFNMQGFSMHAGHLRTEQLYRTIDSGSCELAFTLFFDTDRIDIFTKLKMYLAAYRVSPIFRENLQNIKHLNE